MIQKGYKRDIKEMLEPIYYEQYPFLCVSPYAYTYKTFAKARWLGRPIHEVLVKQFKAYDADYYQAALQSGAIKINGKVVGLDYKVKNGDQIVHESLRKQPPILNLPLRIIHEDDQFVIVDKPPSIVVHTGGGFHFNTLVALLEFKHGYKDLHVLHRLDKCTSGLIFFAKQAEKVGKFHEESKNQSMKKMYYARVAGEVPWVNMVLDASLQCMSHKDGIYKVHTERSFKEFNLDDKIGGEQEIKGKKEKQGKEELPKESQTVFKKVWFNKETDSTLLQCYPITGRTHQIRVHLAHLGFPILNDTAYGGRFVGNKIIDTIPKQQDQSETEGNTKKKRKLNEDCENNVKVIQQNEQIKWDCQGKPWQIMLHSYKYTFEAKDYFSLKPYWIDPKGLPDL